MEALNAGPAGGSYVEPYRGFSGDTIRVQFHDLAAMVPGKSNEDPPTVGCLRDYLARTTAAARKDLHLGWLYEQRLGCTNNVWVVRTTSGLYEQRLGR